MPRIKEHGALVDILPGGGVVLQPATGKNITLNGKVNAGIDVGANDTYVITLDPVPSAYFAGQVFWFSANTPNTGAATLSVNSLGVKTIKKVAGGVTTDLATGDILAGQWVQVVYDGTNFQMLSASGIAAQSSLTNPVVGVGASYKMARGVATITGSGTVATGLTTVVSVTATLQEDASLVNGNSVTASIGDQAGAPAAGSVIVKVWKPTANNDATPVASGAAVHVNWIAVGV